MRARQRKRINERMNTAHIYLARGNFYFMSKSKATRAIEKRNACAVVEK